MKDKKNPIVKILVGIPASGKTTWCENFLKSHPDWVRVNRDDFRKMLRNEPICEFKLEDAITNMSDKAITEALNNRYSVLVDNTNLKKDYIEHIIQHVRQSADIEFQIFDISLEKAIERDKNRDKTVGEVVIKKMYKQYKNLVDSYPMSNLSRHPRTQEILKHDPNLPNAVIFDIDGTLAHMNNKRGPYDWHKVDVDDPDEAVHRMFKMHMAAGDTIIVLSGRDESAREKTEEWLEFYGLKYKHLFMRPKNNFEKDNKIKKRIYENEILGIYNVLVIYDDRDQVVDMWRNDLKLKVFQVNYGAF